MTIACPTVHSLLAHVNHAHPTLIGVDGLDGCRKTTLAVELAGHIHYQVISLDNFLDEKKGAYFDHIDFDSIRQVVQGGRASKCSALLVVILKNLKSVYVDHRVVVIDLSVINKNPSWETVGGMEGRFDAIWAPNAANPVKEVPYGDCCVRIN